MKFKTTQKAMREYSDGTIISVGYCAAWYLLRDLEPMAYNTGVYGWNCDYYETDGAIICTGYRPHGKSFPAITAEFERKARAIAEQYQLDYHTRVEAIAAIRIEWIKAMLDTCK